MINGLKILIKRRKWNKINQHNFTVMGHVDLSAFNLISIGNLTYGMINVFSYGYQESKLQIGCCCSISTEVRFILAGEHDYNLVSTFPFRHWKNRQIENFSKGDIIVDDDVWIGMNVTILSGVHIHQGAVIAAGSVVYRDIPPYAIYASNNIIKYRFPSCIINKLLEIDYKNLNKKNIDKHILNLYLPLNDFFSTYTYEFMKRGKKDASN